MAVAARRQRVADSERQRRMLTDVQQRLRLRHLTLDADLSPDRVVSCCTRLLHNSVALGDLMDGVSLRISYLNQVAADGSYVSIPWDFEV